MSCYEHINSKINSTTVPPAAVVVTAASSQATQQEQTERLDDQTERLNRLELDLQTLNQKYVAEIEKRAQVQHEKEALELELDDLCSKLFEEANDMVAAEKKLRSQVEDELKETKERLLWEQSQLNELRMKLLDNDNSTTTTTTTTTSSGSRRSSNKSSIAEVEQVTSATSHNATLSNHLTDTTTIDTTTVHLSSFPPPPMTFDQYQLQLFTEYVETVSTNTSLPQKKQFQLPFMKLTLLEDIEPCLRFHPLQQPVRKLSSKKIIDHLYKETCLIEYVPTTTTTTAKNICQACNRKQPPINYRFKLNEKETEWLWIDQYCRDRLVAVCEYFVFMRNIQHGFLNHITSIQELYNENIRLKLQMFYSRMGALPVILDGSGINFIPAAAAAAATLLKGQQESQQLTRNSTSTTHSSSASTCVSASSSVAALTASSSATSNHLEDDVTVVASGQPPFKLPKDLNDTNTTATTTTTTTTMTTHS